MIDPITGAVINVIVADATKDKAPSGSLVAVPSGLAVDSAWKWTQPTGFVAPIIVSSPTTDVAVTA